MTNHKATAEPEMSPIKELVTIFKEELKAAREREDRLIRLLEREQMRNAAWERFFSKRSQSFYGELPKELGLPELPKELGLPELQGKLLHCLHQHHPLPLSSKQVQQLLNLEKDPFSTLKRMLQTGFVKKKPGSSFFALDDEQLERLTPRLVE